MYDFILILSANELYHVNGPLAEVGLVWITNNNNVYFLYWAV